MIDTGLETLEPLQSSIAWSVPGCIQAQLQIGFGRSAVDYAETLESVLPNVVQMHRLLVRELATTTLEADGMCRYLKQLVNELESLIFRDLLVAPARALEHVDKLLNAPLQPTQRPYDVGALSVTARILAQIAKESLPESHALTAATVSSVSARLACFSPISYCSCCRMLASSASLRSCLRGLFATSAAPCFARSCLPCMAN